MLDGSKLAISAERFTKACIISDMQKGTGISSKLREWPAMCFTLGVRIARHIS
jgi:hypothetical protein